MAAGRDEQELLPQERDAGQPRNLPLRPGDEAQIQLVPGQHLQLPPDADLPRGHCHLGIALIEPWVHGHEHLHAPLRGEGKGEGAPPPAGDVVDDAVGLVFQLQHPAGVLHVDPAGLSEGKAAAGAEKEPGAQLMLQLQKLLVQGGLGDEQLGRGLADTALLGDGENIGHLFDVHGRSLLAGKRARPRLRVGRSGAQRGKRTTQRRMRSTATSLTLVPVAPVWSRPPQAARAW